MMKFIITDIKEIMTRLESHRLWIETIGEQGEKSLFS